MYLQELNFGGGSHNLGGSDKLKRRYAGFTLGMPYTKHVVKCTKHAVLVCCRCVTSHCAQRTLITVFTLSRLSRNKYKLLERRKSDIAHIQHRKWSTITRYVTLINYNANSIMARFWFNISCPKHAV